MLVNFGKINDACTLFERLAYTTETSWNSLIIGHAKYGNLQRSLALFEKMQRTDILPPNENLLSALLKACIKFKKLKDGMELHAEIARVGLLNNLGYTLVDVYAKCGSLAKTKDVFSSLAISNVISWNAMMEAHSQHGDSEGVLRCFEQMQTEGVHPDAFTFVICLKACTCIGSVYKGEKLHLVIASKGLLHKNVFIGSTLIDMYAKCGLLSKAQDVFNEIPLKNVVSWTALIAGYAEHGHGKEALNCYDQMVNSTIRPNSVTYTCALKACGSIRAVHKGQEIHVEVERKGFLKRDLNVGNTLLDMYAKCGLLTKAVEVFNKIPNQNVVSWTALISGYVEQDQTSEVFKCFDEMQAEGISPNAATFVCYLNTCSNSGNLTKGEEIHAEIERRGLFETHSFLGNTLVDMYAKFGLLSKAYQMFLELPSRDTVSWNTLISGFAEYGYGEDALECFEDMQLGGINPDAVTYVCVLKACGTVGALMKGESLHIEVQRKGLLQTNNFIGSTLVDMYAKCGAINKAASVFEKLPVREKISWNALITGFVNQGYCEKALHYYEQMQLEGVSPDEVTFVASLKACSFLRERHKGQEIHDEISRKGTYEREIVVVSALIDMYVKCDLLVKAQLVFDKVPVRDVVLWNTVISGYAEHGYGEKALKSFDQMRFDGVIPDASTYVCTLKACGSIGATDRGHEIHAEMTRKGFPGNDMIIDNILVDMYAKCGSLVVAQAMFDKLPIKDIVSWNSLLTGYAQLAESEYVLHIFDRMLAEDVKPDLVSFAIVLHSFNYTGLTNLSQTYFEAMSKDYGIVPTSDHLLSVVDLFGRVGELDRAFVMGEKFPLYINSGVWRTVLRHCVKWGDVELGKLVFEHAVY